MVPLVLLAQHAALAPPVTDPVQADPVKITRSSFYVVDVVDDVPMDYFAFNIEDEITH